MKAVKLWLLDKKREKLMKRIMNGDDSEGLRREWALLHHEYKMLTNRDYRKQRREVDRLNKLKNAKK